MDPFSYINREIFLLFALVFLIDLIDTALKRPGPFSRAGPGLRRNHADVVPSLCRGRVYQEQTVSRLLCRDFPDLQSRFRRNATNHCPGRTWRRPAAIEMNRWTGLLFSMADHFAADTARIEPVEIFFHAR